MSKYLMPDTDDTNAIILLKIIMRLLIAFCLLSVAYFVAFASTMGLNIAPNTYVLGTELDAVIRIGIILCCLLFAVGTVFWLLWPLLQHLVKRCLKNDSPH